MFLLFLVVLRTGGYKSLMKGYRQFVKDKNSLGLERSLLALFCTLPIKGRTGEILLFLIKGRSVSLRRPRARFLEKLRKQSPGFYYMYLSNRSFTYILSSDSKKVRNISVLH